MVKPAALPSAPIGVGLGAELEAPTDHVGVPAHDCGQPHAHEHAHERARARAPEREAAGPGEGLAPEAGAFGPRSVDELEEPRLRDAELAALDEASKLDDGARSSKFEAGQFALKGIYDTIKGLADNISMRHLKAAIITVLTVVSAAAGAVGGKPGPAFKPEANEPKELWKTSPFAAMSRGDFDCWKKDWAPVASAELARPGVFPFADIDGILAAHCPSCSECKAGAPCYIWGACRTWADFHPVWEEGREPARFDPHKDGRPDVFEVDPLSPEGVALGAQIDRLLGGACVEEVANPEDPDEARVFTKVFVTPKAKYNTSAAEAAAIAGGGGGYEVGNLASLARARAERIFSKLGADKSWTRESFAAAMAEERLAPKWRLVAGFDQTLNPNTPHWAMAMPSFLGDFATGWEAGDLLSKMDMKDGFYTVRLSLAARKFFCFRDPRNPARVLRFTRLPMGITHAPAVFSALTGEFVQHLRHSSYVQAYGCAAAMYVDDLGLRAHNIEGDGKLAADFKSYAKSEGGKWRFVWAAGADKDIGPVSSLDLTGACFASNVAGKPQVRVSGAQMFAMLVDMYLVEFAIRRKSGARGKAAAAEVPAAWVRSLAGRASWVAQFTYGARPNMGSLWYAAEGGAGRRATVNLVAVGGLLGNVEWFLRRAESGRLRGERFMRGDLLQPGDIVRLFSDASGSCGAAAHWGCEALWHGWVEGEAKMSIQAKELHPIVAAARVWGARWRGKVVVAATDNLGNAYGINKGKAKSVRARALLAELYDLADQHGFEIVAVWLPREYNTTADALSKEKEHVEAFFTGMGLGLWTVEY